MCIVCILWEKDKLLTNTEALKAIGELTLDEHTMELQLKIYDKILEEVDIDI